MKMKNIWAWVSVLLVIALIAGCTPRVPEDAGTGTEEPAVQPENEEALSKPEAEPEAEPEPATITYGRKQGRVLVNQFLAAIDGGNFEIRKILFDRSLYHRPNDLTNLQLFLSSYQYDPETESLEIEYRISNPSELWLYSFRNASMHLSSMLETREGQQALSQDYGYPQTILPPKSYIYFTHRFTDVRNPASLFRIRTMDEEVEIELIHDQVIEAKPFTMAADMETSLEFQDFFGLIEKIENQSWDLIPFKHLTDAKMTAIHWTETGGQLTLEIIPDGFVSQLSLAKEHYRFQVVTDAGEVIPTEIVSVEGQLDEGRYKPRQPVTMTLDMNQAIQDPCTAIQLHMVYAIPTQESRTIFLEDGTEAMRNFDNMDEVSYFTSFLSLDNSISRADLPALDQAFVLDILPLTEMRMKSALVEELKPYFVTENLNITSTDQIDRFEILEETVHSPVQKEIKVKLTISSDDAKAFEDDLFVTYDFADSVWKVSQIKFAAE